MRAVRLWRRARPSDVRRFGDLQVAVVVAVVVVAVVDMVMVVVVVPAVLMAMPLSIAVGTLMKKEGEHAQEAELGVQEDSHRAFTSGALQEQKSTKAERGSCNHVQ